jgi:hypothetical protein
LFFFARFIDKIYVPVFNVSALLADCKAGRKTSGNPGDFPRQSTAIRLSAFPAITIRPQLFDAKSLQCFPGFIFLLMAQ